MLLNRKFDIFSVYGEFPLCQFFPGADEHYWVGTLNHRPSSGYYNFWTPIIVAPGELYTDYTQ